MILKLAAFGLFDYLRNPYNIFDSIIVIIRWQGPWGSAEMHIEKSTTELACFFKKDLAATLRGAGLMHKAKNWETKMSFPNTWCWCYASHRAFLSLTSLLCREEAIATALLNSQEILAMKYFEKCTNWRCYKGLNLFPVFFCLFTCLLFCPSYLLCLSGAQHLGDRWPGRRGALSAEDIPAPAGAEAGALHAGAAPPARGADEDYGQRGHLLHAPHALHLHLQVSRQSAHSVLEWHCVAHGDSSFRAWLHNSSLSIAPGQGSTDKHLFFHKSRTCSCLKLHSAAEDFGLDGAMKYFQQMQMLSIMSHLQERWSLLLQEQFSLEADSGRRAAGSNQESLCMPWMPW